MLDSICEEALPLLVLRGHAADDVDLVPPPHHAAELAQALHRRPDFHIPRDRQVAAASSFFPEEPAPEALGHVALDDPRSRESPSGDCQIPRESARERKVSTLRASDQLPQTLWHHLFVHA